jgi:pyruvate,water dikinase
MEVTHNLNKIVGKRVLKQKTSNSDVLMDDAMNQVIARKEYIRSIPRGKSASFAMGDVLIPSLIVGWKTYRKNDPAIAVAYGARMDAKIKQIEDTLATLDDRAGLQFIRNDMKALMKSLMDPDGLGPVIIGFFMTKSIDRAGIELLGRETITADIMKWSLFNVTTEMGHQVSRIADAAKGHSDVIHYLETAGNSFDLADLRTLSGGEEVVNEFDVFFEKYGMRCPGEIDITKPRFAEDPQKILPVIRTEMKLPKGHAEEKFAQSKAESDSAVDDLINAAREKWGIRKAGKLEKKLSFYRNFMGLRESPKYYWMKRFWAYKQALLRITESLAQSGKLRQADDAFYLNLDELVGVADGRFTPDYTKIDALRKDFAHWTTLTPPRLIFSDGEVVTGQYKREFPAGALGGLAVSSGVVEGRARVILDLKDAQRIEKGDILVTRFTDPSWTPAFLSIGGLVTEIGGMATHGAVVTREYGLPGVVGVVGATTLIPDGARIRVNGDEGYVELL